jgi:hypothetical protein
MLHQLSHGTVHSLGLVWFGISYSQPRPRSYARLAGLADSRRSADIDLRRPTCVERQARYVDALPKLDQNPAYHNIKDSCALPASQSRQLSFTKRLSTRLL